MRDMVHLIPNDRVGSKKTDCINRAHSLEIPNQSKIRAKKKRNEHFFHYHQSSAKLLFTREWVSEWEELQQINHYLTSVCVMTDCQ